MGSSPVFFGSSMMFRDERRSTIWMMGSDFLDGTAAVFFVRLLVPLRATGRAVDSALFRIHPSEAWSDKTLRIEAFNCQCRHSIPLLRWLRPV